MVPRDYPDSEIAKIFAKAPSNRAQPRIIGKTDIFFCCVYLVEVGSGSETYWIRVCSSAKDRIPAYSYGSTEIVPGARERFKRRILHLHAGGFRRHH
jgi:hypothetical protein